LTTQPKTILYIEDDPSSRLLVERTLTSAGYQVMTAERGLEGVDLARAYPPDLILTDINLPDLNGQEIATTLRLDERFKHTPIVALTAQTHGSREWEMAIAAGVNGYITKPIDVDQLPIQVAFYLSGGNDAVDAAMLPAAQLKYTQDVVQRLETRIRELESVNRELRHLDRMKDTFIEITAHELRTPLTLVYGYSRLIEDYPPIRQFMSYDPQVADLVQGMSEAIVRMQSIIHEIVTVSRIMTHQIDLSVSPVNWRALVEKALKNFADALQQRKIEVQWTPEDFAVTLRGDNDLLLMMLNNLISNAIKYTPDGGRITLRTRCEGNLMTFSIRDNGIGIDRSEHRKIFERFHTSANVDLHSTSKTAFGGGGIGLGLAICKGIVEAHDGRIWVESEKRDPQTRPGAEFFVVLPTNYQRKTGKLLVKS